MSNHGIEPEHTGFVVLFLLFLICGLLYVAFEPFL